MIINSLKDFYNTPSVTVLDNRGLSVRDIAYHRHPDTPDVTRERIARHRYDARGFLAQSADPRLHATGRVNFSYLTGLTGSVLRTRGADNGTTVALSDAAGRPFIAVSNICSAGDGTPDLRQALTRAWRYEAAALPGRPVSITEQVPGGAARITERFVYAGPTPADKALNLAGACVSHYDPAGQVQTDSVALTGVPLAVTRRLLKDADNPDVAADWQGTDVSTWHALLDDETYTTRTTADAAGAVLTTTDAQGNMQRVAYDVAGMLSGSWLTVKGGTEQVIVASLTYSAAGQKLREEHGNGVVTTYTYEAETQRLTGIKTERPAGHAAGARVLQDLRYGYDPVGNVLKITNDAEETRFWRNQKVVPENTYVYDSLYQLVSATGREMANAGQQGSSLPSVTIPFPTDSSAFTNYTRTYTYDEAGNLTQICHRAPATQNNYTTNITVSDRSNRGVLSTLTASPAEVEALFTAGGQQTQLQPGQSLAWTPRNELRQVTPVGRAGGTDDRESYRYDSQSQRVLKVSVQQTGRSGQAQRVTYLPGLELRRTRAGDTETERLQVIAVGEAGSAQVRVLHWESGRPAGIDNDQLRYSHDNLTGSGGLELDGDAQIISREEYYPYGGTAILTARSQREVDYKTIRYSGKERDATGLYYYGYRYYQPWAGRWLSADPAGTVDGMNLFRMCRNNPVKYKDPDGRAPEDDIAEKLASLKISRMAEPNTIIAAVKKLAPQYANPNNMARFYRSWTGGASGGQSVSGSGTTSDFTKQEMDGALRLYVTNIGAIYINSRARNIDPPQLRKGHSLNSQANVEYLKNHPDAPYLGSKEVLEAAANIITKGTRETAVNLMKSALSKQKKMPTAIYYRGTRMSGRVLKLNEDDLVITNFFMSVTETSKIASGFANDKYNTHQDDLMPVMYEIIGRPRYIPYGEVNEKEGIFDIKTVFKFTGKKMRSDMPVYSFTEFNKNNLEPGRKFDVLNR